MSSTGMGGQHHSISISGMAIFQQGVIQSGMGGVVIDLASAPIEPGEYQLEIHTSMGGVEIYLPAYVQFVIDGDSIMGGRDVHNGLNFWQKLTHNFRNSIHLPDQIPDHVTTAPEEGRVFIRFIISTGMGGVDIYRL